MKLKLHWQIAIAFLASLSFITVVHQLQIHTSPKVELFLKFCTFSGTMFMNSLKMVMVPLLTASIICGLTSIQSNHSRLKALAVKTVLFYSITGLGAACLGLFIVKCTQPGSVPVDLARHILKVSDTTHTLPLNTYQSVNTLFERIVPSNIIHAASDNTQLLGVIVFSLLFGAFINKLPQNQRDLQNIFWNSILSIMFKMIHFIMKAAPLGIFCLMTPVLIRTGLGLLYPVLYFFLTVILGLSLYCFGILPIILYFGARVHVLSHYKAMLPVLLTAFSTASSAATLPVALESLEKESHIRPQTLSFVLPLGVSIHMPGSALYECVAVMFIAQLSQSITGIPISGMDQLLIIVLSWITSLSVAGIPASSLIAITVVLGVMELPTEAVGIIWATDRILDMCRTTVNVFTNTVGTVLIDRSEGASTAYPLIFKQPKQNVI